MTHQVKDCLTEHRKQRSTLECFAIKKPLLASKQEAMAR